MPLYEYECFLCHHRFERIQRADAEPVSTCPACGGAVRRLLGTPALQFKGSGWYVTDYGSGRTAGTTSNGNGETAAESKTGPDSSSEKTAATKTGDG
jgi:putative FmdB family regulatory protein